MKLFIVNVNDCLELSQYEPFFYEHIYKNQIALLNGIKDTYELNETYNQILSQINQHPFSFKESAVFIFIPRNFSAPLEARDYELYNDINVYLHLSSKLPKNFSVYTFYIDKTDALESSDAVYNTIRLVNEEFTADSDELKAHLLNIPKELPESGNYKEFLLNKIKLISSNTHKFYESVLNHVPDLPEDSSHFKNGINLYIGECKARLSNINHLYSTIIRNDISKDIEAKLRVVYYIKSLTEDDITLKNIPAFDSFNGVDYEHIKRLLVTYRTRLSLWYHDKNSISKKGVCTRHRFMSKTNADSDFNGEISKLISTQLQSIAIESRGDIDVINGIFKKLKFISATAREKLDAFAYKESKELFDPTNYSTDSQEEFDLSEPAFSDEAEEKRMLETMNQHSPNTLPKFSDENKLAQDLGIINRQINSILDKLNLYKIGSFLISLVLGVLSVAGLYMGAQYSIFIKEHTWHIFGFYCLVVALCFGIGYFTVKRRYIRHINKLLIECKDKVQKYLENFQKIAKEFEENLQAAANYKCLKKKLCEKKAARKEYQDKVSRYSWHMMKVDQIIKNLDFFSHFIKDAQPYEETHITLDSFEHDAEHTEFYQVKVF